MRLAYEMAERMEAALFTALRGDAALVATLGGFARAIRQTQDFQTKLVPSLGVQLIADVEEELDVPMVFQFDAFGRSLAEAKAIRRLTLEAVHSDYTRDIGGLMAWSRYVGGRREDDPESGVSHLSFDIEYHPYREYGSPES